MKLLPFPKLRQTYGYDCGAVAIESILGYYGLEIREGVLLKLAKTTKSGTYPPNVIKTLEKYGLKCHVGEFTILDIKKYIDKKIPIILLIQAWTEKKKINWEKDWNDGHYVVAIGYDKKRIYFEDPSSLARTYLNYKELEKRWHDKDKYGKSYINFGIAVYGKKPKFNPSKKIHMG